MRPAAPRMPPTDQGRMIDMQRNYAAGLAAAFLLAAAPLTAHAQNKVFALVPKAMNNPFFDQARDGCKKAAAEIGGIECYYIGPGEHGGGDEQLQMVQDLI